MDKLSSFMGILQTLILCTILLLLCWIMLSVFFWIRRHPSVFSTHMREFVKNTPYEHLLAMAKGKRPIENLSIPHAQEQLRFYTVLLNTKIRRGFYALLAAALLSIIATLGIDIPAIDPYLCMCFLLVYGIITMARGYIEVC